MIGEWRSLVAHLLWEQRVAGSNPVSPTSLGGDRFTSRSPEGAKDGGPGGIRTPNLAVMSGRLYR
jgi:hypothetical protein